MNAAFTGGARLSSATAKEVKIIGVVDTKL
jgi:hypothetical protein